MIARALNLLSILCIAISGSSCSRSDGLKGQTNTTITFYGKAVDQDGKPLVGARIEYQVDAYPKDWTFETRGRPYEVSFVSATSDEKGNFQFVATGCILRLKSAERSGYRHLYELDGSDNYPSTSGYDLIAWGDVNYRSAPDNPAVFVFVRDGVTEVSALPSVGGLRQVGSQWSAYKPAWPNKPSLKDVKVKSPTTQPAR